MSNTHNQVKFIAKIVCDFCLKNRNPFKPQPYKELCPTKLKIDKTYQILHAMGVRGRFTETKSTVLLRAHLFSENIFPIVASNIELMCNFDNGSVRYWDGFGAKKRIGFEQSAENWKMMMEMDDSIGEMESGFMEYQVYIGPIWTDILPYLES